MNRRLFILSSALFICTATFAQSPAKHKQTSSTLQAHVEYTGSGTVDSDHRIFVVIWDSPDFMNDSGSSMMPLGVETLTSKSGDATFKDVAKTPVYLSMAYDPTGNWKGGSKPPAGTSLGIYSQDPGTPEPIRLEPGKVNKISATLDDSYKAQ